jgi:triosephosphate isomerase
MTFIVIANFKSNKTQIEVKEWLSIVTPTPNIVVAPSYLSIPLINNLQPTISIAAQDVSPFPSGAYTGAINAKQLKDLGVSYAIVGHAERRRYFHESSIDVAGKVRELVSSGLTPVVCMEQDDIVPQLRQTMNIANLYCFEPSKTLVALSPPQMISSRVSKPK